MNKEKISAVRAALSPARMRTYEAAAGTQGDDDLSALELYAWNAEISGAFLPLLHVCEVVTRNAIADVLETVYGPQWPWSLALERSLPNPLQGYSPRKDLQNARRFATTGKVIPELKFVFWQKMFTSRYDARLWNSHLLRVLPNMNAVKSVAALRESIYNDLEQLRNLRNRIAHHEPIFARHLSSDYERILKLVTYRCATTAAWLNEHQRATTVIAAKPVATI